MIIQKDATRGVFYVATEHARFVAEACHAAESLRTWEPDIHVMLFTDRPDALGGSDGIFDAVEPLPVAESSGTTWGSGLLAKITACVQSPYERSLYLDTDTRVLKPRICELFALLDTYELAMTPCQLGESRVQMLAGRPMFNGGMILFRNTAKVQQLMRAWLQLQQAHLQSVRDGQMDKFTYVRHLRDEWEKKYHLVNDQIALARYLAPDVNEFGIRYLALSRVWNWRRDEIDDGHANEVVIHHANKFKVVEERGDNPPPRWKSGMKIDALFSPADHHPVVITPWSDANINGLREYLTTKRAEIDKLLLEHGGVLFRGFGLRGADDFRVCAESLGARPFGYVGGNTPRTRIAVDVFTSTEYPASEVIGLHHEMSYLPSWPRRLFFYSLIPASTGGQTSLASSRDVLRALPSGIVSRFREKKITYIRNFHPIAAMGKGWQATYQTQDRAEVDSIAAGQGSACAWLPGEILRVSTHRDALAMHPVTGEELWFNQAEQWHPSSLDPAIRGMFEEMVGGKEQLPHYCEYGDGEPLEEDLLHQVRRALTQSKLLFDWQPHDFLVIDNMLMMHGRESFKGERKTLAYLSAT